VWAYGSKAHSIIGVGIIVLAIADFNGDSVADYAGLFVSVDGKKAALFAFVSSEKGILVAHQLENFESLDWLKVYSTALATPGIYKTACGKGYFEC